MAPARLLASLQPDLAASPRFEEWRTALDISLGGHARGELVLLPAGEAA